MKELIMALGLVAVIEGLVLALVPRALTMDMTMGIAISTAMARGRQ